MPKRKYRATGVMVLDPNGGVLYDFCSSPQEAKDIAAIINRGIGTDWDVVEPELERIRRERTTK